MSGSTKAGEPSMEEILASIRKIIADDPSKAPSSKTVTAVSPGVSGGITAPATARPSGASSLSGPTGALPPSTGALGATVPATMPSFGAPPAQPEASGGRNGPAFGRLSEALRATFATAEDKSAPSFGSLSPGPRLDDVPPVPLASSTRNGSDPPPMAVFRADERSRSIESELDDILNEPLAGGRLEASDDDKKDDKSSGGQWAVWRTAPAKGDDTATETTAPGIAAGPSPTPAASLGRPSGGFYPSGGVFKPGATAPTARIEPSLTPLEPAKPELAAPGGSGGTTGTRDDKPSERKTQQGAASLIPRFDPKPEAGPPPALGVGSKPAGERLGGKPAPVVIAAMPSGPPGPVAEAPPVTPAPISAAPPVAPGAATGPASASLGSSATSPVPSTTTAPSGGISVPLPPRANLFSRPFTAKPEPAGLPTAPSPPVRTASAAHAGDRPPLGANVPAPSRVVARSPAPSAPASALDALAAGLAASNVTVGAAPSSTSAAASAPEAGVPRSLEDSVADMIKPMLQKWIDDNMPRIIEKALRNETGGGKSGS